MKRKHNEGSSLIEVLVGIVVLALIVVPTCTSLVMSARINAKAEQLLQDQLAVSSAVETLMAEGIPESYPFDNSEDDASETLRICKVEDYGSHYKITVAKGEVFVTTQVKKTGGGT